MNLRVRFGKLFDRRALVRREVVGDHVDLFAARLVDHDVGEEGDQLRRGVPLRSYAQHFAGLRIAGSVQRQRDMPVVLKAVPFGAPGIPRQHRIRSIQGLNSRFLIDAEHRGVRRRVQIQADDIGCLRLEVRIVRSHVGLDPIWLQSVRAPHSCHHHVADVQVNSQLSRAPVRRGIAWRTARRLQDPGFQLRGENRSDLAQESAVQSSDPLLNESFVPARDKAAAALDPFGCSLAVSIPYAPHSST
jgi:hypothetical protein